MYEIDSQNRIYILKVGKERERERFVLLEKRGLYSMMKSTTLLD